MGRSSITKTENEALEIAEAKIDAINNELVLKGAIVDSLKEVETKITEDIAQKQIVIDDLNAQTSTAKGKLTTAKNSLANKESEVGAADAQVRELIKTRDELTTEIVGLRAKMKEALDQYSVDLANTKFAEKEIIKALYDEQRVVKGELHDLGQEKAKLQLVIDGLNDQINKLNDRISNLILKQKDAQLLLDKTIGDKNRIDNEHNMVKEAIIIEKANKKKLIDEIDVLDEAKTSLEKAVNKLKVEQVDYEKKKVTLSKVKEQLDAREVYIKSVYEKAGIPFQPINL